MLLWIEGFEQFAAAAGNAPTGLTAKYSVAGGADQSTLQAGRAQGLSLNLQDTGANCSITTPGFGNLATWVFGFGFKPGAAMANNQRIALLIDAGTEQCGIWCNSSGQVEIRRSSTLIATSVTSPLIATTWCYLEAKITIGNSAAYEIRVNGTNVLSGTADTQQTANAFAQSLRLWANAGATTSPTFDDWYIADTTAGVVDDFIGSHRAVTIFPSGEGDTNDFTPSAGTDNSAMVDDVPHDTDSTYVESGTDDHLDLYEFQDPDLTDVKGVQLNALVRETDATPFSVELVSKTGATTDVGPSVAVGSPSYVNRFRVLETDPDTTVAWTDSGIDGAQFGIQIDA